MQIVNRLSIMTKVLVPAGIVVAVAAGSVILSKSSLSRLNDQSHQVIGEDSHRLTLVIEMQEALYSAADKEKAAILSNDPAAIDELAGELKEEIDGATDAVEELLKTPGTAEERAKLTEAKAGVDGYAAAAQHILALAREQKDEEAFALAMGEAHDLRAKADELGDELRAAGEAQVQASLAGADRIYHSTVTWLIGGTAAGLIAALGLLLWLAAFQIARPVKALTALMRRLAAGDLSVEIPSLVRGDEIGQMIATVRVFKDNAVEREALAAGQRAQQETQAKRGQTIEEVLQRFDARIGAALKNVAASAGQLDGTARQMTQMASDNSRTASAVAAASEEASSNVQTVAAATEELSASIREIGTQVQQSQVAANHAAIEAERTNVTVKGLVQAAQKINEIVEMIGSIASQTNLLALNATIEAARAGEAGRGFAVVASEVKSLANQTAKATEEVAQQIGAIQSVSNDSANAIASIGSMIANLNQITTTIAAAVEEQGAATQEIARNVQEAAGGTTQVSTQIGSVNEAAERTGAAASQVLSASGALSREADELKRDIESFLAEIRAA